MARWRKAKDGRKYPYCACAECKQFRAEIGDYYTPCEQGLIYAAMKKHGVIVREEPNG